MKQIILCTIYRNILQKTDKKRKSANIGLSITPREYILQEIYKLLHNRAILGRIKYAGTEKSADNNRVYLHQMTWANTKNTLTLWLQNLFIWHHLPNAVGD